MLNRELQESMNLPPFINTAGGLGEPLPGRRRGEDEEERRTEEGKEGNGEGEKGRRRGCVGGSSSGQEAEWPAGGRLCWLLALLLLHPHGSAAAARGRWAAPDFRGFVSPSRDRARPMASAIFKSAPLF